MHFFKIHKSCQLRQLLTEREQELQKKNLLRIYVTCLESIFTARIQKHNHPFDLPQSSLFYPQTCLLQISIKQKFP